MTGWGVDLRGVWLAIAICAGVLCAGVPLSSPEAQNRSLFSPSPAPLAGGRIGEILVEGNQRIEDATVRSYMRLRSGDPYDPGLVDQSLKTLFATGLFADVSIRRQGADLVITVVENPIINRLAFEGNRRIDDETLEQEVQLRPRVVYTRSRVQADVQRLLQVYRRNGRFAAQIEPKVIQLEENRVDLVFEVTEGDITGVQKINFIGNRVFKDDRLKTEIATKETRWYRFLSSNDTYDPDRLTLDRELLRKFYLSRGYADFRVSSAVAELARNRKSFFITFALDEGEMYTFGAIDIETSLKDLDPTTLRGSLSVFEGGEYNAEEVEKSIENLTFAVGQQGYAFVDIKPRVKRDREARTIAVTFQINEGPRVYVERINVVGNVRTLDEVVRREFRLVEGDAFNAAKIRRSRTRIRRLGYFDKVDITRERGSAPDKVVLNVEVEERSTGELSFGVGVSSAESVLGDISIRERNLLGRGQDLEASFSLSTQRQQVNLSFTEPYFLDREIAAGFDVFKIERDLQDRSNFDQESVGGTLRAGFSITELLRQGVRYTLKEEEISSVGLDTSEFIRFQEGGVITSSVGYDLTFDTRDERFEPNEGVIIRGGQDIAGLGGDARYVRTSLLWAYYYPFTEGYVGSLTINGGAIYGLGYDITVTDRYFVGGDNFRGFESGGLGPRDLDTDDSVGGNAFYVGTASFRFPLSISEDLPITGRVFSDFGTLSGVDGRGSGLEDSGLIRASVGVGVSWRSPFGPIRVDIAAPVRKESYDKEELFRFSFGTRF